MDKTTVNPAAEPNEPKGTPGNPDMNIVPTTRYYSKKTTYWIAFAFTVIGAGLGIAGSAYAANRNKGA